MFNLKNVKKFYKAGSVQTIALNDVSIDFPDKGLVVLLGKSGSGKSTLLNILGGLDKPTSGDVFVAGKNIKELKGYKSDAFRNSYIGYIFQEFNLIDELSVHDNIEMTLRIQDKTEKYMAVDDALEMVGLNNLGHRKPTELSGGQRQRVAIARALIKNSEILLADEPTGALDSNTAIEVFETLKKVSNEKLVIVVTHDSELAYDYATRVIEMSDGQVVRDVTRKSENEVFIRFLSDQVIEVSQGESLTLDIINKNFNDNEVNYVGINYDLDRVTLAYPEIIDTLDQKKQTINYSETLNEDIIQRNLEFKLRKGKLSFKYALGLAKKSIITRKKKFNRLVLLASIGFSFTVLSLITALFAQYSFVNRTIWHDEAIPLITVTNQRDNEWSPIPDELNEEQRREVARIMGVNNVGIRNNGLSFSPIFPNPVGQGANPFLFNEFGAIITGASLRDLSLNLIVGTDNVSANRIIISDFAAHHLIREGFLGTCPQGIFTIHHVNQMTDLENFEIVFYGQEGDRKTFIIAGIFETNFRDFEWILTTPTSQIMLDRDKLQSLKVFNTNNEQLYSAIIASEEIKDYLGIEVGYKFRANIRNWIENPSGGHISPVDDVSFSVPSLANIRVSNQLNYIYSGNLIGDVDVMAPEFNFNWNDVIISRGLFSKLWDFNLHDQIDINDVIVRNVTNGRYIWINLDFGDSGYGFRIINVIDSDDIIFIANDPLVDNVIRRNFGRLLNDVVLGRGSSSLALARNAEVLNNAGFAIESSVSIALDASVEGAFRIFGDVSGPFLITGLVFLGLSFLITLNYLAITIRMRKKELLVYKVLGARNFDLAKIFFAEGLYIGLRMTIVTSIAVWVKIWFISLVTMFPINILSFSLLYILFIMLIIGVFLAISMYIPVRGLISKKPSEAMKLF